MWRSVSHYLAVDISKTQIGSGISIANYASTTSVLLVPAVSQVLIVMFDVIGVRSVGIDLVVVMLDEVS